MVESQRLHYFKQSYPDSYKLAGSEGYGAWREKMNPVSTYPSLYREWRNKVIGIASGSESLRFTDAGCGNGSASIPFALSFADRYPDVTANFVDIQQEGLQEIQTRINGLEMPANLSINCITARMQELPLADKSQHGLVTTMAFHWLEEDTMYKTAAEFERVLTPNGYLLLTTCSIYNAMGVGIGDDARFQQVQEETQSGKIRHPYPVYHQGYQRWTHLLTEPALRKILNANGLTIRKLQWYKNNFPNGQSDTYKEAIRVLAQKVST